MSGLQQFTAYVSGLVKPRPVKDLLQSSDVVGNIRFSRPTLYIFPGGQGDSALFGISGFNLLVNGGYARKACFWDFTRHLDRIDAMLYTHLAPDNLFGLCSVLERKAKENVHPEIGYIYMNGVDKAKHSPNGDAQPENGGAHKAASLVVNLVEEGSRMVENLRNLGQIPHPCVGSLAGSTITPINLYHKVGHGTLDMYVLNPLTDSKDLKEFFSQWNKHVSNFSSKGGIPVPNACSVCALLVWRPSSPAEKITRILFPGSAPQPKVFEGLDKLKSVDIFQHALCSEKSLSAPPAKAGAMKKAAAGAAKPPAGKAAAAAKAAPAAKKTATPTAKAAPAKSALSSAPKGAKEATNKKAAAKASPASSKASSKAGSKASTPKSTTPAETPKDLTSPTVETAAPVNGMPDLKTEPVTPEANKPLVPEPAAAAAADTSAVKEESLMDLSADATTPEMPKLPPGDPMTTSFIDMDTMGDHPMSDRPEGQEPVAAPEPDLIQPAAADETASMPEADQAPVDVIPAAPAPAEPATEKLPSPDALPEPVTQKADPMTSSYLDGLSDEHMLDAKALEEAGVVEDAAPEVKAEAAEVAAAAVPAAASEPEPIPDVVADADHKKQMEDLGIFDADAPEDEAPPAQPKQNDMEDLGIYDDEPAAPMDAKTLEDLGIIEDDSTPQDDAAKSAALPEPMSLPEPVEPERSPSIEEVKTPKTPDHQDASPEADHVPFNGEPPQSLPEPEEPEPAMLDRDLPQVHVELQKKSPDEPEVDFLPEHSEDAQEPEVAKEPEVDLLVDTDSKVEEMPAENKPASPKKEAENSEDKVAEAAEPASPKEVKELDVDLLQSEVVKEKPAEAPSSPKDQEAAIEPSEDTPKDKEDQEEKPEEEESSRSSIIPAALPEASHKEEQETEEKQEENSAEADAAVSDDDACAEECDGSDVSGGLTADDLAQCPEPEVPLEMPEVEEHDSLMQMHGFPTEYFPPLEDERGSGEGEERRSFGFEVHDGPTDPLSAGATNPFLGLDGASGTEPSTQQQEDIPADTHNGPLSSAKIPDQIDRDSIERDVMERDSIERDVPATKDTAEADKDSVDGFDPLKSWGEPMSLPPPTPRRSLPVGKTPKKIEAPKKSATPKKDPVENWEAQGLPAPPPPADGDKKTAAKKEPGSARKSMGMTARKTPASAAAADKKKVDLNKSTTAAKTTVKKTTTTTTTTRKAAAKPANGTAGKKDEKPMKNGPNEAVAKKAAGVAARKVGAARPATAGEKTGPKAASGAKRPATTTGAARASPAPGKPAVLGPVVPFYVDLTYVPCHGDANYVDLDFFRRVRARYYVISALSPNPNVLTYLLEAKQTWDNPDQEVTIIPTFDNDAIRHWMGLHRDQLSQLKIDVAPSASRCTIQLQDHETSCAAFRLEF